jgi:IS5 family transposase
MLRIHFMQNWFTFSDRAMEEALIDTPLYREFARLNVDADRLPDAITILRFRHLLERHGLAQQMFVAVNELLAAKGLVVRSGTAVDATIINAPSSTKNSSGERDPHMHQTQKGQQWYFGMKAHVGTDLHTGVVHSLVTTPANAADVTQVDDLLHGEETDVFADAGYQGAAQWTRAKVRWHIAMRPGKRRSLDTGTKKGRLVDELERVKARIRAKGEHAFRVIKRQFGFTKGELPGLGQEHGQAAHAVHAGQPVDAAQAASTVRGMSASAHAQMGAKTRRIVPVDAAYQPGKHDSRTITFASLSKRWF